jgi:hypothetical protein
MSLVSSDTGRSSGNQPLPRIVSNASWAAENHTGIQDTNCNSSLERSGMRFTIPHGHSVDQVGLKNMCIPVGRGDAAMPQSLLHEPQRHTCSNQARGGGVAQITSSEICTLSFCQSHFPPLSILSNVEHSTVGAHAFRFAVAGTLWSEGSELPLNTFEFHQRLVYIINHGDVLRLTCFGHRWRQVDISAGEVNVIRPLNCILIASSHAGTKGHNQLVRVTTKEETFER